MPLKRLRSTPDIYRHSAVKRTRYSALSDNPSHSQETTLEDEGEPNTNILEKIESARERQRLRYRQRYQRNKEQYKERYQQNKELHQEHYLENKELHQERYQKNKELHQEHYQQNKELHQERYQQNKKLRQERYQQNKELHREYYQQKKDQTKELYQRNKALYAEIRQSKSQAKKCATEAALLKGAAAIFVELEVVQYDELGRMDRTCPFCKAKLFVEVCTYLFIMYHIRKFRIFNQIINFKVGTAIRDFKEEPKVFTLLW
jgi:DNA mismatch repair ATPase MutL